MTGEVVNLRQARKAKARAAAKSAADANAARSGRTKAERARDEREAAALDRRVSDHLIDRDED